MNQGSWKRAKEKRGNSKSSRGELKVRIGSHKGEEAE